MYNEKYISDFDERMYLNYLTDKSALKEIADSYINQYTNSTYDCTIAFKESLDHYILKQIKTNPDFLKTHYFKNYLEYINYIFFHRISSGNTQLEYNTNIIFSDSNVRNIILSYYKDNIKGKVIEIIKKNESIIKYISNKLFSGEILSQIEFDYISDYLYTRRNLNSPLYNRYIEYLLNNLIDNSQINNSPQIMAAYIAYLPKIFGDGCENSRILLTNGYASDAKTILPSVLNDIIKKEAGKSNDEKTVRNLRLYSCGDKYISISKKELDLSLRTDKSLDISRTSKIKDLYWITMVCFHELTHQYQTKQMKNEKFNSSGFSAIIRSLIYSRSDYINNHDSYEMEIEADENAWKKMYDFIFKYRSSRSNKEEKKHIEEQLKKCRINQDAVYSRRTFLTRKDSDFTTNYFKSDMDFIINNFKNNSKFPAYFRRMWNMCPMMQRLFTEHGQVKTTLLLNENITSSDFSGLNNNIMSSEISNYILTSGYQSLKKHVSEDDLTEKQVQNLMINIYNTYHLDKMFVRALSEVDLEQYKETHHNFDLKKIRDKYLEKFKSVASLVYKERELVTIINRRYPHYNIENFANPKYAMWNYSDMFKYLYKASNGVVEFNEIEDVLKMFQASGDLVLGELANNTLTMVSMPDNLDFGFSK